MKYPVDCSKRIGDEFERYTKKYYTSKKIVFFEDYPIDKIIETSMVAQRWEEKFKMADKCKDEFLNLSICQEVIKIINESSVNEFDRKTKRNPDKTPDVK